MTTKEQESVGGAGPAGRAAGRDDATESKRAELPSVIVSPEAYTPGDAPPRNADSHEGNGHDQPLGASVNKEPTAPTESEPAPAQSEPAPSASTNSGPSAEASAAGAGAAAGATPSPNEPDFSEADADRFAAKFRPSWEAVPAAMAAAAAAPAKSAPASVRPSASLPPAPAYEPDSEPEISAFPGASQRRRALWMTAAAVAGFVVLFALALRSSHSNVPAKGQPAKSAASSEQAVEKTASRETAASAATPASAPTAAPAAAAAPIAPPPEPSAAPSAAPPAPAPQAVAAAPSEPPAAPTPSAEAPAAALAAAAPKPEAPSLVRIRVTTVPAGAELLVDGALVPNPFETNLPHGGKHRLRAHTDGYHSRELSVVLDHDQDVELRLDKREEAKPSRPAAPPPTPVARVRRAPAPIPLARPAAPRRPSPPAPANRGAGFVSESPY